MRMGNYFRPCGVGGDEMAVKQPRLGIRHPTVIPTNLRRDETTGDAEERADAVTAGESADGE